MEKICGKCRYAWDHDVDGFGGYCHKLNDYVSYFTGCDYFKDVANKLTVKTECENIGSENSCNSAVHISISEK